MKFEEYKWNVPIFIEREPTRPFVYKIPFKMEFLDKDYRCFRLNSETLKLEYIYSASKTNQDEV